MSEPISTFIKPSLITLAVAIIMLLLRLIIKTSTLKIARKAQKNEARSRQIIRYVNVLLLIITLFVAMLIWGIDYTDVALIFSSTFAVIGVAFFAIWSVLSNITSGVIMFIYFPYKIGDKIKIHDKDFPIEAVIEDIKAFQLHLRTEENELITYPNNLFLQKPVSLLEKDVI
ncbi:MAG: mechanosensitive ion channel domain-containing protein [Psychroflexus halocasei]|uniref:mechanosensitive ion channel domain-containing protein n=1 Tax=Psychroflexus sp. S27 TaxID=1982757 RepID=UPI000C29BC89|nr:mechanosensitive ion channel domain-containing protein [Psychroflexus sp. S27]PJX25195.1 mechanosensitive ion channel protein MscS [Psychroflexus sp. S27]